MLGQKHVTKTVGAKWWDWCRGAGAKQGHWFLVGTALEGARRRKGGAQEGLFLECDSGVDPRWEA